MKQPADRITEAYYNDLGDEFGKKVRERIHWVCSQATGERILDIGCSQGITDILLAREGKDVLGIDIMKESIDIAKQSLEQESEITQSHVEFRVENFMDFEDKGNKYDVIIMAEVLEHITDPRRFIGKAQGLLEENGKVIITIPFGINDYFDHKKTYYMYDMYEMIKDYFRVSDIHFLGKWISFIAINKESETNLSIDENIIKQLESNFYEIERDYVSKINGLNKKTSGVSSNKVETLKKELVEHISNEQEALNKYKLLLAENERIKKDYKKIKRKYDALSNSKLGRLQLRYWNK
ncbi:methyltransferase domain-containing protein [Clostridium sp. D2Q-11]|uniref:Methyltransferase domain-containing protein n=1 Tax=Anaeromonas frigoriresistens TaxID=2683708 RepID=A0A942Z9H6_9FIRM|nr:methyltransferase domain-containing protein [Anaeromonas frigoriresistens]MBS4539139.1 methyltransferase domain-containing protein [Anaeromonas frigoriresistens]